MGERDYKLIYIIYREIEILILIWYNHWKVHKYIVYENRQISVVWLHRCWQPIVKKEVKEKKWKIEMKVERRKIE